jgi:hypothetical protein
VPLFTVKVNVPATVGVPVIVSVVVLDAFSARPVGSVPEDIDHVAAVTTVIVPELYAVPTVAFGNVVGVIPVRTMV